MTQAASFQLRTNSNGNRRGFAVARTLSKDGRLSLLALCVLAGMLLLTGCGREKAASSVTRAGSGRASSEVRALHEAVLDGDLDRLRTLIQRGADVEGRLDGLTPLQMAASIGNVEIARFLLAKGADVNARGPGGRTALDMAMGHMWFRSHLPVVELLLSKGANPNLGRQDGVTPLFYAARYGDPGAAKLLLKHGADPRHRSKGGATALHWACGSGRKRSLDVARLLIDAGADVNARTAAGNTPLRWAVERKRVELAALLLDRGADPTIRSSDGKTPLERAKRLGNQAMIRLLADAVEKSGRRKGGAG